MLGQVHALPRRAVVGCVVWLASVVVIISATKRNRCQKGLKHVRDLLGNTGREQEK